jgi:hypothetical protein
MHLSGPSWVHAWALIVNSLISIRSVGELAGTASRVTRGVRRA